MPMYDLTGLTSHGLTSIYLLYYIHELLVFVKGIACRYNNNTRKNVHMYYVLRTLTR